MMLRLPTVRQIRKAASLFSCCIVFGFLCELIYLQKNACNEMDSMRQIQSICAQYHNKEIVGNMCSSLCDESVFALDRCHGNAAGKKVFIMSCDGCVEPGKASRVVLKVEYDMERWHLVIRRNITAVRSLKKKSMLAIEDIQLHSREYYDTDMSDHADLISYILGENYKDVIKRMNVPNAEDLVLTTAMGLGSQEEFLSYKILGAKPFLPKLYGVCGPAYFVEYTPSFSSLNYIYFTAKKPDILGMKLHFIPWEARAKAALSILRMVPDIEDNYESPLQICDIQTHNFGLSDGGESVLVDSDSLKFGQVIKDGKCEVDKDCHFITCKGKCNQTTHVCEKEMFSDNLQTICSRVFVTSFEVFGLLRGAPPAINDRLREVLRRCMYPEGKQYKIARDTKSDRTILKEIESLLKSTL